MERRDASLAVAVSLFAFLLRGVGIVVTTVTPLNPYSHNDVNGFARSASVIADTVAAGSAPTIDMGDIYTVWGAMLSPFWLLPGPSRLYARLGMALLGALAVYNVYVIASHYHSSRAGLIAAFPVAVFPSYVFVHATVLREAMVLFGLTTAGRLLLAPSPRLSTPLRYSAVAVVLSIATILRPVNAPVLAVVLVVGGLFALDPWREFPSLTKVSVTACLLAGTPLALWVGSSVAESLARLREIRARGRTEYLGWVFPDSLPEAFAFSWIGAAYFLFSPFPWMVETVQDVVIAQEAMLTLMFAVMAVFGVPVLIRRSRTGTVALATGLVLASVLYGLGTANVGTAVRHRQMFVWVLFVFGGTGVAEMVRIRYGRSPSSPPEAVS